MSGKYDETMKKFVSANPQDFIDWLCDGAVFELMVPTELLSRKIFVDILCRVTTEKGSWLAHVEFQRNVKAGMSKRVLEYNILAHLEHKEIVHSIVIYLTDEGTIEESPLVWELPDGEKVLEFHYYSIRMSEVDPSVLTKPGREGVLPLLVLTKGNAHPNTVDLIIERLQAAGKEDILPVVEMFASLVFQKNEEYKNWLQRRFAVLRDILRDTEPYQRIFQEGEKVGREKEREEGREKWREEGAKEILSETLVDIIQKRYPKLKHMAKAQIDTVQNHVTIQRAILQLISLQTEDEVMRFLRDIDDIQE